MKVILKILSLLLLLTVLSCSKTDTPTVNDNDIDTTDTIIDYGDDIEIEFLEGLNDNSSYTLPKDSNGFYYLVLNGELQMLESKIRNNTHTN